MEKDKRYFKSTEMHERALKTIPLGSQTFSKSRTQYPVGVSPLFIQKGKGSHVWDVDGNEYIDFVSSLAAVTLGYADPDVNEAVSRQLQDGIIFSLPHPLEFQVAEKIREMVPCAEMTRFGKNGSDATSGAIRLARAHTQRDRVAMCGYHGWQDWSIGSTARHRGVPKAVRELTHTFSYNNIDSLDAVLKKHPGEFAAVILEPMNSEGPKDGFLQKVKELAHKHGALFILDETITGFRLANGGAQQLFGVTPDLATFGKGMANGFPVSAVSGKAEYMKLMEEIFFSFTFGGEALSLAAALATMTKLQKLPVVESMRKTGTLLKDGVQKLLDENSMGHILSISGDPSWSFLLFKDVAPYEGIQVKTLFEQEVFSRGVIAIGTHNMSYAHSEEDIVKTLKAYREVFPMLKEAVDRKRLLEMLRTKPLELLFKIR